MNDQSPNPPHPTPGQSASTSSSAPPVPPPLAGASPSPSPEEHLPVSNFTTAMDSILRQPRRVMHQLRQTGSARLIGIFVLVGLGCGLIYGLVVGTFSGGAQLWGAPIKVALGILVSAIICLPSLYIFSCLAGSAARLGEIVGLVAGLVALMTILLVGFAPVAWVFSQSTESVVAMGLLHMIFLMIATLFGLRFLNQGLKFLGSSLAAIKVWMILFVVILLQMTTALRPIVGKSPTFLPTEKKLFLTHWLDEITPHNTRTSTRY